MDAAIYAKPTQTVFTADNIFFKDPEHVIVDEDYSVNPPCPESNYDTLVVALKRFGPLVIRSTTAPGGFTADPTLKKNKACGEEVHGWKKGIEPRFNAPQRDLLVVGAQRAGKLAVVYFRLADDTTGDDALQADSSLIRRYTPSKEDTRLFTVSYNIFRDCLNMAHPVCPYGNWLFQEIPTADIAGDKQGQVHAIGQKIFEHYRTDTKAAGPNCKASRYARQATLRVWLATGIFGADREERKANIKAGWSGIGDKFGEWDKEPYVRGRSSNTPQGVTLQFQTGETKFFPNPQ